MMKCQQDNVSIVLVQVNFSNQDDKMVTREKASIVLVQVNLCY